VQLNSDGGLTDDSGLKIKLDGTKLSVGADGLTIGTLTTSDIPTLDASKISGTAATLNGSENLTNKTLTSPVVSSPDIDGGTIDGATIATSDVTIGTGKTLDVSSGTSILPQATDVSGVTASGQIAWDSDDKALFVGDGTDALQISNPFGNAIESDEITNDTITNDDINSNAAIADTNSLRLQRATR